ncbi:MAG: hypothetical protein LUE17_17935 [Planctomycetaceae bacterium]|nr:hypothetical protein [Planctomycetaceae bacterium]
MHNSLVLTISTVLILSSILVPVYLLLTRRPKPRPERLLVLRETYLTTVLALSGYALAIALLVARYINPSLVGDDDGAAWYFVFLCGASAVFSGLMLLNQFLRSVIVYPDSLLVTSLWGEQLGLRWDEVDEVRVNAQNRLILKAADGRSATIGGNRKTYREFIRIAAEKIPPESGEDILEGLCRCERIRS